MLFLNIKAHLRDHGIDEKDIYSFANEICLANATNYRRRLSQDRSSTLMFSYLGLEEVLKWASEALVEVQGVLYEYDLLNSGCVSSVSCRFIGYR